MERIISTLQTIPHGTHLRVSPDGQSILFASDRRSPMVNFEIFQLDIKSGKVKQLTDEWGWDINPYWSPDGKNIVFASDRAGQFDIYTMDADGKNVIRLTQTPWHEMEPAWSPPSFQAINPTGKRIESWGIMKRGW